MENPSTQRAVAALPGVTVTTGSTIPQGVLRSYGDCKAYLPPPPELVVFLPATASAFETLNPCGIPGCTPQTSHNNPTSVVAVPAMSWDAWRDKRMQQAVALWRASGVHVPDPGQESASQRGDPAIATIPQPPELTAYLLHIRLRDLRQQYWDEATKEHPLTPAEARARFIMKNAVRNGQRRQERRRKNKPDDTGPV